MTGLTVSLLGGFEARLASGASLRLPTRKAQALLAYLSIQPGRRHQRDKLAALLWGDLGDDRARDGLRHALVTLRKAVAGATPPVLEVEGQSLALNPAEVEVDVVTFEQKLSEGTPLALEHAADVYRGDLLLGFTVNEPLFEEWLVAQRERLREMALEGMVRLLAHQTKIAGTERAIQTALRLLALDPLQEPVHRALMSLYARQGRRGAALKQYQACVGVLRRELGTEPEPETRRLYHDLLRRPPDATTLTETPARARARPTSAPPDLPSTETPLIGREPEIGRLRELLDEAGRGRGHVITVLGEAGIGKTRLVSALAAEAAALGCRLAIGRCHESDSVLSFGPWVDAVRSSWLSADDDVLTALHPRRRAELTRLFPEAAVAGLPPAGDAALPLFEGVAALIEHVATRQPLVLVLEDLHWADEISLRLLAFVSRRLPAWPALLVATARADELADASTARRTLEQLARGSGVTVMALKALSQADTGRLVRALARVGSDEPALAVVEARVWTMSEGNPFVAVEAMRGLDEPAGLVLPTSVRELVLRRLDRLGAHSQHLVAVAAVIGRRFDFGLLQSAAGMEESEVAEAVEEMVRYHVLQAVGNQLDFAHDRVRDVAYGRIVGPRRRLLHRAVAGALEAKDGQAGDRVEQIAHHVLHGDAREKAVPYLRRAAVKAAARSALQEARAWLEQALSVLATSPESRATLEEGFEVRAALRAVLAPLGEFRRLLGLLREAEAIAERLDDDERRGRVCAFLTAIQARVNNPDEALVSGQRALEIAARRSDLRLRILTTSSLVLAHYYRGEHTRVVELATENLAALPAEWIHESFGSAQPSSISDRFRLLASLAHLGRFAEAAPHADEVLRLAEITQHAYSIALAHQGAGTLYLAKGEWARAQALLDRQVTVLRAANIGGDLATALAYSARALVHLGEPTEALARMRESEQLLQGPGERVEQACIHLSLARASLVLGRLDAVQTRVAHALTSSGGRVDHIPQARQMLGDLASHPDRFDPERAEMHYREAFDLAERRGMRPAIAQIHLGLGTMYVRAGARERAAGHLHVAATMLRELDMGFWLEQAEAELVALR